MTAETTAAMKNMTVTSKHDDKAFEASPEYANYFCEYAKLYHQKDMLEDVLRMRAYHGAIVGNPECFKDKVVLDVGSGTGVLAMWCAQAGAKKVYAVEATPMAAHARRLVQANGLADVVEVIQSKVEDIELPCKVDVIVSEWMGYLLVRESMLDSVIYARDRWLKDGGALYPSHAQICWGALTNEFGHEENAEAFQEAMGDWSRFLKMIKRDFNLDMSPLSKDFEDENREYYLNQAYYRNLRGDQVLAENTRTTALDLSTVTVDELRVIRESFEMTAAHRGEVTALGSWFITDFRGGRDCPTKRQVSLDTGPKAGDTHWGQQVFYLPEAAAVDMGDTLRVTSVIQRHKDNDRMVHCTMGLTVVPKAGAEAPRPPITYPPRLFHVQ
jgi:protein arginine N-methyltransferase 1